MISPHLLKNPTPFTPHIMTYSALPTTLTQPKILFTDVDDTLTYQGELPVQTLSALHALREAGVTVIPVTGGCAGWCDFMLRTWPVSTVIGESGSFWLSQDASRQIHRHFVIDDDTRAQHAKTLAELQHGVQTHFPELNVAVDQDFRLTDLALDTAPQLNIPQDVIFNALNWLKNNGAQAKLSSIQINAWMGNYSKASTALLWLEHHGHTQKDAWFVGDSLNDESMFEHFEHTVGVANIASVKDKLSHHPKYITSQEGGHGFVELCRAFGVI